MQDVISVGTEGKALRNAILYSDGRADEQARVIIREAARRNVVPLGDAYIAEITGNHFDGSMPLAKILWLKENEPDIYARTACFLISSKDYIIGRLTSVFAGDMTACSTAGAMDLTRRIWSEELIGAAGVDIKKFPKLFYGHECVGTGHGDRGDGEWLSGRNKGLCRNRGCGSDDTCQRHLGTGGVQHQPRNLRLGGSRIQPKDGE